MNPTPGCCSLPGTHPGTIPGRSSSSGFLQGFTFLTEEKGKKQKGTAVQEWGAVFGVIPARLAVQPSAHSFGVAHLGAVSFWVGFFIG